MIKKFAATLSLVLALTGASVALVAGPASAHTPAISASCNGVVLHAVSYDSSKVNTWTVTVGTTTTSGTFGDSYDGTVPVPQGGATTHVSATIADADNTPAYTDTFAQDVGPCGVVAPGTVTWPDGSSTCNTYTLPALDSATEKYPLADQNDPSSRYTAGVHPLTGTVSVVAHTIASANVVQESHTYTFTTSACAVPIVCSSVGTAYTEAGDHTPVDVADGKSFVSAHDGVATEFGFPVHYNLQGISSLSWTTKDVVGNGIFIRFVVDLSADGGSSYNSFSVTDSTVTQASIADVGSKNVFLGKTIAQVAALYPDNIISSIHFQTGSAYAAGDGATLTGISGDCGSISYASVVNPPPTGELPTVPVLASTGSGPLTLSLFLGALASGIFGLVLMMKDLRKHKLQTVSK